MNVMLIIAGTLSAMAAALHIACIYFGAPWYRLLGAGEHMAKQAEQGSSIPTIITSGITLMLFIWSLYAFSAAGLITKLPLMRLALIVITSIYLVRGVAGFFFIANPIGRSPEFWLWSSAISLSLGTIHLIGLIQQWHTL
ncbi:MAG: hypothetical protein JKY50_01435 [Oleispira sp.]|nr:hypothetical protein [Oleispira sp.]MBL4879968.1 hypothetical protein [Oleispira sp.]